MHKILVIRLYFHYTLYMFRTVLFHLQEQPFISCMSYLVHADTSITTQQPEVSAYTKYDIQFIKVAPDDGLIQSENMYSV